MAQGVSNHSQTHKIQNYLLVGENEQKGFPELVLVEHALELIAGFTDTVAIVRVDDEDDALGVLEVVAPEGADLVLTTDIPYCERDVLVLDSLDVEACALGGGGGWSKAKQGTTLPMVGMVVTISPSLSL